MKIFKIVLLISLVSLLLSCGNSNPKISHVVVKSNSSGILLDTDDSSVIKIIQKIFYEKEEMPDAGPEFKYLVDITIGDKTTRWQYSKDGFIRNYEEAHSMIYLLRDVAEFNRTAKIR